MFTFVFLAVLCTSCLAAPTAAPGWQYSISPVVGAGSGTFFSTAENSNQKITAIRAWENTNSYIAGLQMSNGYVWSAIYGRKIGKTHELQLYDGEGIIQVSGKYNNSNYIYQLIFVTSRGRSLIVGRPYYTSFNLYPAKEGQELIMLTGRHNTIGLRSLGAHWGVFGYQSNSTNTER